MANDELKITGKVIALQEQSGVSNKTGNTWKKQEFVVETQGQYPKKVCFQLFGEERIAQAAIQTGNEVTVSFDINSREYQGRWFTNIDAWKVEHTAASSARPTPPPATSGNYVPASTPSAPSPASDFSPTDTNDDLPF
ncbi:hypothetical protein Barb4_03100 [Bacteroidales bacterium Barb4]|nr:hypothetical protein Barb4_03100 [Bacteroidales bacterium Barb4]